MTKETMIYIDIMVHQGDISKVCSAYISEETYIQKGPKCMLKNTCTHPKRDQYDGALPGGHCENLLCMQHETCVSMSQKTFL